MAGAYSLWHVVATQDILVEYAKEFECALCQAWCEVLEIHMKWYFPKGFQSLPDDGKDINI